MAASPTSPSDLIPPPPPAAASAFPTLEASILGLDGTYSPLQINSRHPVPIDTPLFEGHVLLLVRPETEAEDPYYMEHVFKGKRRRFEVQIQGRFKVAVDGILYTGGEVTIKQMQLGLLTRGVARGLLSLISAVLPIHYSFGQPPSSSAAPQAEAPHIVSPLMISADRMVVTPFGQPPPPLGAPGSCNLASIEKDAQRKARRADAAQSPSYGHFDTTSTYTFSFNTSNVDLPTWQLRGLPLWENLDLRSFWDSGGLRIVCYRHRATTESVNPSVAPHTPSTADYAFAIQIQPVDPATRRAASARKEDGASMEGIASKEEVVSRPSTPSDTPRDGSPQQSDHRGGSPNPLVRGGSDDEDLEADEGIDRASCASFKTAAEFLDTDGDALTPTAADLPTSALPLPALPPTAPVYLCGGAGSVPARVQVLARGSHTPMLLVAVEGTSLVITHSALTRLLPRALWAACAAAAATWGWSPRLLAAERQRRIACYALDTWLGYHASDGLGADDASGTRVGRASDRNALALLKSAAASPSNEWWNRLDSAPRSSPTARLDGTVLFAESESAWREERMTLVLPSWRLSEATLTIGHPKPLLTFRLLEIISCEAVGAPEHLSAGLVALEIGTLGRVSAVLLSREEVRAAWISAILGALPSSPAHSASLEPWANAVAADPKAYLHRSSVFRCSSRRVLNCRRIIWRGARRVHGMDACALVARALRASCEVCALLDDETMHADADADVHALLTNFFDLTSELKHVEIERLTSRGLPTYTAH